MQDWTPDELKAQIESDAKVFLKLWKSGCGPCKMSKPALERIESSGEFPDLVFGQINTSDFPEMLEVSGSEILPCFFIFKDKQMQGKFLGFKGLEKLKTFITEHQS